MGLCDPKAVRAGTPWYKQVNNVPMNTCPACPHGKGFRCNQCWPTSTITKAPIMRNQGLTEAKKRNE